MFIFFSGNPWQSLNVMIGNTIPICQWICPRAVRIFFNFSKKMPSLQFDYVIFADEFLIGIKRKGKGSKQCLEKIFDDKMSDEQREHRQWLSTFTAEHLPCPLCSMHNKKRFELTHLMVRMPKRIIFMFSPFFKLSASKKPGCRSSVLWSWKRFFGLKKCVVCGLQNKLNKFCEYNSDESPTKQIFGAGIPHEISGVPSRFLPRRIFEILGEFRESVPIPASEAFSEHLFGRPEKIENKKKYKTILLIHF